MKIAQLVAKHIEEVVHGNWTDIYLDDTVADITYMEAVTLPAGITNSIAMLLRHISFYNDVVMERLANKEPSIDSSNGFDVIVNNEEEWRQLKTTCLGSFEKLAAAVSELADEKLWGSPPSGGGTYYKMLHGICEHAHYHLGQIVLLKKIIRAGTDV
jgi:hypothetical protein